MRYHRFGSGTRTLIVAQDKGWLSANLLYRFGVAIIDWQQIKFGSQVGLG